MKKTFLILCAILIGVFALLSVISIKGEYNAEKKIWTLNRKFADIVTSKESNPPQAFDNLANGYREFMVDFPNSRLNKEAQLRIARVYMMKPDYVIARQEFEKIFEMFPEDEALTSQARSLIGKSYELSGEWPKALQLYREIQKERPFSNTGLSVPLYIAQYHQAKEEKEEAERAFAQAIAYYNRLISEHPNSEIELKALRLLSVCYLTQQKWMDAINVMEKMLLKYPAPRMANQAIVAINNIAIRQLKNYDVPINIYNNFIEKNPEHPLNDGIRRMITAFEKLKNENVIINLSDE